MGKILSNIKVYDLEESMVAAGYAMRTSNELHEVTEQDEKRCKTLVKASRTNGAHAQFLTGIRVNFDVTFSNKVWVEAERYRFFEFVTSQSTMHRITSYDLDVQYTDYVDPRVIDIMKEKIKTYKEVSAYLKEKIEEQKMGKDVSETIEKTKKALDKIYLEILYTNPAGFKITARIATNYRCLLNMYNQRYNHPIPEWGQFCQELEELPKFTELAKIYMGEN